MDSRQFDSITRQLAAGASRRGVMKGLLAGGAAGLAALLGRQPSQAQGCEAACAQGECAGLQGQAKGECMRSCTGQCGCPTGYTFCPDDGLCYDLLTNNCHCADPDVSGGSPCGGFCGESTFGRCCENGICSSSPPSATCPVPPLPSTEGYCTAGIRPRTA
jgi:hypothetical protein